MKVVINTCYGGFSLSPLAIKRLAELNGKECFFFKQNYSEGQSTYIKTDNPEDLGLFFHASSVENFDPENSEHYLDQRPDDRADPLLIQVVKELGKKADGACAKLKIVNIPDGIQWHIDEYDGMECVAENHQTWS